MKVTNPLTRSGPLSPKFHGAWLGAGTGVAIANVIIGLIETYGTHKPLPQVDVTAINLVVAPLLSAAGAWLAPLVAKFQTTLAALGSSGSVTVTHVGSGGGAGGTAASPVTLTTSDTPPVG